MNCTTEQDLIRTILNMAESSWRWCSTEDARRNWRGVSNQFFGVARMAALLNYEQAADLAESISHLASNRA